MKFITWFFVALVAILLIARFKPQSEAEPIIPTELKESQGDPEGDKNAPPARSEEEGKADAQHGGTSFVLPSLRPALA
jgi:hypothetical protein